MPTKTFNTADLSIPYIAYGTAGCSQTYSDSISSSATGEVNLILNYNTAVLSNQDAVNFLQDALSWQETRFALAEANWCFWSLKYCQCHGCTPACGQPYQPKCTGWTGLQCSCNNQGYLCNKTKETLLNYRNGWEIIKTTHLNAISSIQALAETLQAELEDDVNNAVLYEDLQQVIETTNRIVAESNLMVVKSAQAEYTTKILQYVVPALLVLVVTGLGVYLLKKFK